MSTTLSDLQLKLPFPARKSAEALRNQLIEFFLQQRPAVGERFYSDHELVRLTRLSRPTVRRALDQLHEEGWIERRHGRGTYIGPRVAIARDSVVGGSSTRRVARLAVLVHELGDFSHDWYSPAVLKGIDEAAEEAGVSLGLLGDRSGDVKSVSRRLVQMRPDVLACTAPNPRHAMLIGEAQRLGIPVIGTGSLLVELGLPSVCEDGVGGAAMAVRHLIERGHRRIGFVQMGFSLPWIFQRREGYRRGLREAGIDVDENLTLWLTEGNDDQRTEMVREYVERQRPTAVLFGCFAAARYLVPLVRQGLLQIPQDLSIVTFDQHPLNSALFGGLTLTTVALPLTTMGRRLAMMARDVMEQKESPRVVSLSCELVEGDSVAALNHSA